MPSHFIRQLLRLSRIAELTETKIERCSFHFDVEFTAQIL